MCCLQSNNPPAEEQDILQWFWYSIILTFFEGKAAFYGEYSKQAKKTTIKALSYKAFTAAPHILPLFYLESDHIENNRIKSTLARL